MLQTIKHSQTSVILRVKLLDSSSITGAGLTGLTSASSGLRISTIADNEATATAYTVAGSTIETITTLGTYAAPTATKCRFKEVDATNHPGVYELHFADARFAVASAKSLLVSLSGATNLAQADFIVQLDTNTAADVYTRLGAPAAASVSADVAAVKAVLPAALVSGRIDASVGAMAANVLTATAIASDAITDAKVASDVTIASVTGAVGSVTGAVGSVTGNVGGNVVGSVASVTAAVTVTGDLSATMKASVNTEVDTAISDASLATAANLAVVAGYLDTEIAAIKAKTDSLTFTQAGHVDANIQRINDVVITGNGQSGTEFGV